MIGVGENARVSSDQNSFLPKDLFGISSSSTSPRRPPAANCRRRRRDDVLKVPPGWTSLVRCDCDFVSNYDTMSKIQPRLSYRRGIVSSQRDNQRTHASVSEPKRCPECARRTARMQYLVHHPNAKSKTVDHVIRPRPSVKRNASSESRTKSQFSSRRTHYCDTLHLYVDQCISRTEEHTVTDKLGALRSSHG